ncbi:class E sortase [Sinomonas sp. ASV322]|uniref:class E sortase n=1 Tax=Sinomonas sp. ASV322 TaxID=3041920 RepID=UPI0027DD1032|nr:class E sortase [Sinomonas sp. ASV322]MDQ4502970.1 class E sortase [Sinomonas sp. ASV322]
MGRGLVAALWAFAELLITFALCALLFVGWYDFYNPWVVGVHQQATAAEQSRLLSRQIAASAAPSAPSRPAGQAMPSAPAGSPSPAPLGAAPAHAAPSNVPVMAEPGRVAAPIGVIYIPRLGDDWRRIVRETVDTERVLNSVTAGVGHYEGTAMPGGMGNFAVAAHDIGYGNSFLKLSTLRLSDKIYVQTAQGWYTYTFRNFQFVQPSAVDVINAVPAVSKTATTDRLMTLTTCYPAVFPPLERAIAYAEFEGFDTAAPAALASILAKDGS